MTKVDIITQTSINPNRWTLHARLTGKGKEIRVEAFTEKWSEVEGFIRRETIPNGGKPDLRWEDGEAFVAALPGLLFTPRLRAEKSS